MVLALIVSDRIVSKLLLVLLSSLRWRIVSDPYCIQHIYTGFGESHLQSPESILCIIWGKCLLIAVTRLFGMYSADRRDACLYSDRQNTSSIDSATNKEPSQLPRSCGDRFYYKDIMSIVSRFCSYSTHLGLGSSICRIWGSPICRLTTAKTRGLYESLRERDVLNCCCCYPIIRMHSSGALPRGAFPDSRIVSKLLLVLLSSLRWRIVSDPYCIQHIYTGFGESHLQSPESILCIIWGKCLLIAVTRLFGMYSADRRDACLYSDRQNTSSIDSATNKEPSQLPRSCGDRFYYKDIVSIVSPILLVQYTHWVWGSPICRIWGSPICRLTAEKRGLYESLRERDVLNCCCYPIIRTYLQQWWCFFASRIVFGQQDSVKIVVGGACPPCAGGSRFRSLLYIAYYIYWIQGVPFAEPRVNTMHNLGSVFSIVIVTR